MQTFNVAIIGNGITALSAAKHLADAGVDKVCIISPQKQFASSPMHFNFGSVTLQDNISRMVHNHGSARTNQLLKLNGIGFKELTKFLLKHQIYYEIGTTKRLSDSIHESDEVKIATTWLSQHGFPAQIRQSHQYDMQIDGAASLIVDFQQLLNQLSLLHGASEIHEQVVKIDRKLGVERITLDSGQELNAEMVILACHNSIKKLAPQLETVLINYADQKVAFELSEKLSHFDPGDFLFAQHSQYWAAFIEPSKIICGGARFLRRHAGIEAETADVLPQITNMVKQKIENLLQINLTQMADPMGFLDIRACDEVPVIGPMYGHSNLLVASWYMGSGLTLGFAAGKGLAEFITTGRSQIIPEFLHPKRFRSLPSDTET